MAIEVKSIVEDAALVARRRSQLVLAAIKLFCREGFRSTTVKDIARVADVSAGLVWLISTCIERCVSAGYMRKSKVELLTYHLVVVSHAWALKYWRLRRITTLDEYIRVNIHSVWEHLLTEKGLEHYQAVMKQSSSAKRAAARA